MVTESGAPVPVIVRTLPALVAVTLTELKLPAPLSRVVKVLGMKGLVSVPLTVKVDPRVRLPTGALEDQLRLATQLARLLSESSRALLAAKSEQAQLKALASAGATAEAVRAYQARLAELLGSTEASGGANK